MNELKYVLRPTAAGLVPAFLELILLISVEPAVSRWILFQASFFWFTCGFTVYMLCPQRKVLLFSIGYTVFLNIPWYIAESFGKGNPDHFAPLICASIVQGIILGFTVRKLKPMRTEQETIA